MLLILNHCSSQFSMLVQVHRAEQDSMDKYACDDRLQQLLLGRTIEERHTFIIAQTKMKKSSLISFGFIHKV